MQNIAKGRKIRWILLAFRDEIRYNKGATKEFCWVSPLRTCEMVTAITISLFFIVVGGLNGLDSMSPVRRLREKMKAVLSARKG